MRLVAVALCFALSGCSWFSPKKSTGDAIAEISQPIPTQPRRPADIGLGPAMPDLKSVITEVKASSPAAVRQAAEIVESSSDRASARDIKESALYEVVRMSAWAMGLGFLAFLLGGVVPVPGVRAAGGWTVGLGAAIATLAPWLNGLLGDERVHVAGYAAFSILAFATALGCAWWFLDKVRDATKE